MVDQTKTSPPEKTPASATRSTSEATSAPAGYRAPESAKKKSDAKVAEPAEVAFGDAALVRADDADGLESLVEDAKGQELVVLKADVIEEFYFPFTLRPSHVLLYNRGRVVAKSEILERAAAIRLVETRGSDDSKVRAASYLDGSTLAAGTWPGIEAAESAK